MSSCIRTLAPPWGRWQKCDKKLKRIFLVIPQDLGRYRHAENTEMNQVKLRDTET